MTPFRIAVPQQDLDDLRERLRRTRWPDELPGVGWAYGVPLDHVRGLASRWMEFDWRAAEARLNEWPQNTVVIDGTRVHFAHLRSDAPDALPLLMTHGWPGSFAEFTAVAGPLTRDFHLVLPSIPGFGFSGPTPDTGWEVRRIAKAFAELMERLGYQRYGVQGGDWGAAISRELGRAFPDRVVGVHLNLLPGAGATQADLDAVSTFPEAEQDTIRRSWERNQRWQAEKQGYADLQSTRPQTLSYALTDSPVGQLAWIAEKFHEWTDPASTIDSDELLTIVSIYWFTGTAGSSARVYYERAHAPSIGTDPSPTPTALAVFPHDNFIPLRHIADRANNIVRWTEHDRGGHFPAMEVPDLLVADTHAFFANLR